MSDITGPTHRPHDYSNQAQRNFTEEEIDRDKDKETKKDVATGSGGAPMALGNVQHQDSISSANAPGSANQDTAINKIVDDSTRVVKDDNPA